MNTKTSVNPLALPRPGARMRNLAAALAESGRRVAVLDADIYGPSQPGMLGAADAQVFARGDVIMPTESHGLQFVSMGLMLDAPWPNPARDSAALRFAARGEGSVSLEVFDAQTSSTATLRMCSPSRVS